MRLLTALIVTLALAAQGQAQSQLLGKEKQILELTKANWVHFRDFNGRQLIYFTHLESYRCGVREVRYSLNTDKLDKTWDLADCDPRNPHAIPEGYLPYLSLPLDTARSIALKLTFIDGSESDTVFQYAQ